MRHHNHPIPRETEPERKQVQRLDHGHQHSNTELMVSICRRLIPLLEKHTTEDGMKDAEECTEAGLRLYGPSHGEETVLLSKLYSILKESEVNGR